MMHWNGWDGMGSFGWIGMTLMILFWFGLIALVILALARLLPGDRSIRGSSQSGEDRAIGILRERFARGEITEQEFEEARRTLNTSSH
jgi:putative membrane protein